MYKVIFDKTDASKSHAIAFDEKAKYPGLAKNADGSCAQYGYDKYPGFVYCMPAASFVEYLTQTAEINFEYWDGLYETLEDASRPMCEVKTI